MGLGPPVCLNCSILMKLYNEAPYWRCAKCNEDKRFGHLWEYPKEKQKEIEENTHKFYENLVKTNGK